MVNNNRRIFICRQYRHPPYVKDRKFSFSGEHSYLLKSCLDGQMIRSRSTKLYDRRVDSANAQMILSSLPTFSKISNAFESSSRVWRAVTMVRTRHLSAGT